MVQIFYKENINKIDKFLGIYPTKYYKTGFIG